MVKKADDSEFAVPEGDMTPMIDMTFQLIAFFMVLINFSDAEVNEAVQLPASQLAKPPEVPPENQLTLQLTADKTVLLGGQPFPLAQVGTALARERQFFSLTQTSPADVTVILRADKRAEAGVVQEVIAECQKTGFERFALRAKQDSAD